DRDVRARRARDGDRDDVDVLGRKEGCELVAVGPAEGDDGARGVPVREEGARDVDALAARVEARAQGPVDHAGHEPVDLDRAVEARVERHGEDHARTTLGPAVSISSAKAGSSPVSVMTVSTASIGATWAKSERPNFVWSAMTTVRRAAATSARLTPASPRSGVVSPRSAVMPFVPRKATSA